MALVENLPVAGGGGVGVPIAGFGVEAACECAGGDGAGAVSGDARALCGGSAGVRRRVRRRCCRLEAEAFAKELNAATAKLAKDGWALAETRVEVVPAGS